MTDITPKRKSGIYFLMMLILDAVIYLQVSLVQNTFKPTAWSFDARTLIALAWGLLFTVLLISIMNEEVDIYEESKKPKKDGK